MGMLNCGNAKFYWLQPEKDNSDNGTKWAKCLITGLTHLF